MKTPTNKELYKAIRAALGEGVGDCEECVIYPAAGVLTVCVGELDRAETCSAMERVVDALKELGARGLCYEAYFYDDDEKGFFWIDGHFHD